MENRVLKISTRHRDLPFELRQAPRFKTLKCSVYNNFLLLRIRLILDTRFALNSLLHTIEVFKNDINSLTEKGTIHIIMPIMGNYSVNTLDISTRTNTLIILFRSFVLKR